MEDGTISESAKWFYTSFTRICFLRFLKSCLHFTVHIQDKHCLMIFSLLSTTYSLHLFHWWSVPFSNRMWIMWLRSIKKLVNSNKTRLWWRSWKNQTQYSKGNNNIYLMNLGLIASSTSFSLKYTLLVNKTVFSIILTSFYG